MEITGIFKHITPVQQSKNGHQFVEFVIEETGVQYPQSATISLFGAEKIQAYQSMLTANLMVTVRFVIKAREYNGKWYNSLSAWEICLPRTTQPMPMMAQPQQQMQAQVPQQLQGAVNHMQTMFAAEPVNNGNTPF